MPPCAGAGRSRPSAATRQLRGTFAQVVVERGRGGVSAERDPRAAASRSAIRPVITAHPTEAKRVTVLEKHRRIYRRLVDLESPRWTPRERQALVERLRNEIELLWLTGELRLAKPTVPQEVFWALHFFNETLFEAVPDLLDKLERALAHALSRRAVPGAAVLPVRLLGRRRPGRQSVRHQRGHPEHAAGEPAHRRSGATAGGSARAGARAQHHRARRAGAGRASGRRSSASSPRAATATEIAARNPGEVFRQYLACMRAPARCDDRRRRAGRDLAEPGGYATAEALVADLRLHRGAR